MASKVVKPDYSEHKKTYDGFMKATKWSIIGMVIVVLALYFIIQP